MRLLTVRQPHAWAIVTGRKDTENRPWLYTCDLGTWVAIIGGKTWDPPLRVPQEDMPDRDHVGHGVVGFVRVIDDHTCDGRCSLWAVPGCRHWRLADAVRLDRPIPAVGALGLRFPAPELLATLTKALLRQTGRTVL